MLSRRRTYFLFGLVVLAAGLMLVPAVGQQIHRHGFSNKQTALVRGDTNLRVEELEHDISTQSFKSQPSSEHIRLRSDAGTGDAAFIHYFYETPPAPIAEVLTAGVWVKATKSGMQLRARVVFPKEPDPHRPDDPLTTTLIGDTYDEARVWRKLTLTNVPELLAKHLPVLRTKVGRDVNTQDAYIDRLILNVYSGPGPLDVWVDDLDIGPVAPRPAAAATSGTRPNTPGTPVSRPGHAIADLAVKAPGVVQQGGQLFVDGKPFLFRAIRHSGTPLYPLRMAGFNTVWFPADATPETIEEAAREGFLVVPTLPPIAVERTDPTAVKAEADRYSGLFQKFLARDSVLFWDLGGGYRAETLKTAENMARFVRDLPIPRRPLGADVWDDFSAYSLHLDLIGAHRWPLFTSLELGQYRDWLSQRRALTATPKSVFWTWIQTHLPDWYVALLTGRPDADHFDDPVGPQPEQIRLLTYLSLASGCRGVGFWSDRYLASTHHGRDRLLGLALLNSELDMLAPVLTSLTSPENNKTEWLDTDRPNVKAAIIRRGKGVLVLPIWLGDGSQYVPAQGAAPSVTMTIKLVPEGADPWFISPAGVLLRSFAKRVPGGTELTIPDFDLVTPVVFTDDLGPKGLVVQWQDYNRTHAKLAAQWALDLSAEQYLKVLTVHQKLVGMGVDVKESDYFLRRAREFYKEGQKHYAAEAYDQAYTDALRALRPLRVLMRDHWDNAVATLSTPSASPYAVSFYTLPQHWQLAREVKASRVGANALAGGDFEPCGPAPKAGLRVDQQPGWSARMGTLDRVNMAAGIVPSEGLADLRGPRKPVEPPRTLFPASRKITTPDEGYLPPAPELGANCLRLEVRSRIEFKRDGKPAPNGPVLERTFLAVDGPVVRLTPGTLVRVSAWLKIPEPIVGSADGFLFYDDAGGEPLGVRISSTPGPPIPKANVIADGQMVLGPRGGWKQFFLYRRVPASGQISVTLALTGVGVVYADDIRIEPLTPSDVTAFRPAVGGVVQAGGVMPAPSPIRLAGGTLPGAGGVKAAPTPGFAPTSPTVPPLPNLPR